MVMPSTLRFLFFKKKGKNTTPIYSPTPIARVLPVIRASPAHEEATLAYGAFPHVLGPLWRAKSTAKTPQNRWVTTSDTITQNRQKGPKVHVKGLSREEPSDDGCRPSPEE